MPLCTAVLPISSVRRRDVGTLAWIELARASAERPRRGRNAIIDPVATRNWSTCRVRLYGGYRVTQSSNHHFPWRESCLQRGVIRGGSFSRQAESCDARAASGPGPDSRAQSVELKVWNRAARFLVQPFVPEPRCLTGVEARRGVANGTFFSFLDLFFPASRLVALSRGTGGGGWRRPTHPSMSWLAASRPPSRFSQGPAGLAVAARGSTTS